MFFLENARIPPFSLFSEAAKLLLIYQCLFNVFKLIKIIFNACLRAGVVPSDWKTNFVPTYLKGNRQNVFNHKSVSFFPVLNEVFKKTIHNAIFQYFLHNEFILPNQSSFRSEDSCRNQLIAITREINKCLNDGLEVW